MLRKKSHSLAWGLCLWLLCFTAYAELDGPDMYVYVEVSVREATIDGMRQRLTLLQSPQYTLEADAAVDQLTRVRIADVYAQFGTTPGAHVAYGTRNAARIEQWLDENPTWKGRYATLDSQFRSLSNQLSASRREQ
jgi:hypothetical protein